MSKSAKPKAGTRGAPRKKILKSRQNISIDPAVLKAGRKLAFADGLSLSSWIAQLIRARMEVANSSAP